MKVFQDLVQKVKQIGGDQVEQLMEQETPGPVRELSCS
jgi:transcriptional regulator with PAS, ATPase and Fis domain